jgi:hypothetical protein
MERMAEEQKTQQLKWVDEARLRYEREQQRKAIEDFRQ